MRKKPMKRLLATVLAVVCVVGLTSTACAIDQPPVNSATSAWRHGRGQRTHPLQQERER